jgi:hypothetical protein
MTRSMLHGSQHHLAVKAQELLHAGKAVARSEIGATQLTPVVFGVLAGIVE